MAGGGDVNRYALSLVAAMSLLCAVFVTICVTSFVQARRRLAAQSVASDHTINLHQPPSDEPSPKVGSRESA